MSEAEPSKAALRTLWRARRRALAAGSAVPAATRLAAHLDSLPIDTWTGMTVAAYLAAGSEIDPAPLVSALRARGARIALPVVMDAQAPLIFRIAETDTVLVLDAANIPAPPPTAPEVRPDLILAPLLAFDDRGGRLGQGGGFYDRTLEVLRKAAPVRVIGLAFAGQRADHLVLGPHDQRLDGVLTEDGYRAASEQV
jgi:5-formyltetrahydrofolate cyclo-ligase